MKAYCLAWVIIMNRIGRDLDYIVEVELLPVKDSRIELRSQII